MIRQHSPELPLRVPQWHPIHMRRPFYMMIDKIMAACHGFDFRDFMRDGEYAMFSHQYLLRETKGIRGVALFRLYEARGGDKQLIRGQLWLS